MRAALAIATVVLLLLTAAAPHAHATELGQHGCPACVTAGADHAAAETPEVAPVPVPAGRVECRAGVARALGAPLGAIPGQSPPARRPG